MKSTTITNVKLHNEVMDGFIAWKSENNPDGSNKKLHESAIFEAGFMYALQMQEKQKKLKEDRKNKVFIPADFINTSLKSTRYFLVSLHYENGYLYTTDGTYLVKVPYTYNKSMEGKTFDEKGAELICQYPKCEKVIPDMADYKEAKITKDDIAIADGITKVKSLEKLSVKLIMFDNAIEVDKEIDEKTGHDTSIGFSLKNIRMLKKFWDSFPDCKLYYNASADGKKKAWVLKDSKKNLFVVMPLGYDKTSEVQDNLKHFDFKYDTKTKNYTVVER